ncbi:MAG: hypothetical protein ABSB86_09590 [Bryobacteraceae bacterium]
MNSIARWVRVIAGVAVLGILAAIAVILVPPYVANWKLQRYVNGLIDDPSMVNRSPAAIQSQIAGKAASLGLPLHAEDVRVTTSANAFRIDALYVVHVDIAGYSVDLHFRPAAGGS